MEKRLVSDLESKNAEREAFFQTLPEDVRRPYEAVRRGRTSFSALAEVKGMACLGCRTKIPPDVVNQVMKGKEIIVCESCSRLLYILPAASETDALPPSA